MAKGKKDKKQIPSSIKGNVSLPLPQPFLASKHPTRDFRGEKIVNGRKVRV